MTFTVIPIGVMVVIGRLLFKQCQQINNLLRTDLDYQLQIFVPSETRPRAHFACTEVFDFEVKNSELLRSLHKAG